MLRLSAGKSVSRLVAMLVSITFLLIFLGSGTSVLAQEPTPPPSSDHPVASPTATTDNDEAKASGLSTELTERVTLVSARFSPTVLNAGEVLRVEVTVRNDGNVVAWSQGPNPEFQYNEGEAFDSLGYGSVRYRWRIGVNFGPAGSSYRGYYPYRWGWSIGLAPGETRTIVGYIRLTTPRTQDYWVGLVEEQVIWHQENIARTSITVNGGVTCPQGQYKAEYFNNRYLSGAPVFSQCENGPIDKDWFMGGPGYGIGSDDFSVRWTGRQYLEQGEYEVVYRTDDGLRVWLDSTPLIDEWRDQGLAETRFRRTITAGYHDIKVEYYEHGGAANVRFRLGRIIDTLCSSDKYKAEYFNNRYLSGNPLFTRCEDWPISKDWGYDGPGNGLGTDNFSVRWTGRARIEEGDYTLVYRADDGLRVWLNGSLLVDSWRDQVLPETRIPRHISAGDYDIKVEYYENGGAANVGFRWERGTALVCPSGQYKAEYFGNTVLSGTPLLTRCENAPINYEWGGGGPSGANKIEDGTQRAPEVNSPDGGGGGSFPTDNFSVRWTGRFSFNAAAYTFNALTDDGMRVYIDGNELLNEWRLQGPTPYSPSRPMTAGEHEVRVEYYENAGGATAKFSWQQETAVDPACGGFVPPDYSVSYYSNTTLSGSPTYRSCGRWPISQHWDAGGPGHGVPNDLFSARYTAAAYFEAGTYVFTATGDDGYRVSVDGNRVLDEWRLQGPLTRTSQPITLSGGYHDIVVEYYENLGGATLEFDWRRADGYVTVVEPLSLSTTTPSAGQTVVARFKVRNTGGQAMTLWGLAAGARRGSDWSGEEADFPHVTNITLQPGQDYVYQQQRSFSTSGSYFAEPVLNLNGNWGGIAGATRVNFTVSSSSACPGAAFGFEQTASSAITTASPSQSYCFTGASGTWASIRMFAIPGSGVDTYVRLYRPDGSLHSGNDDGAGVNYNSFLVSQLDQTGVWRLEATRYDGTGTTGSYRLRLERGREASLGDVDRNCSVDEADRQQVLARLQARPSDPLDANWSYDLNLDGIVDAQDAALLIVRMTRTCSSSKQESEDKKAPLTTPVPSP